MEEEKKRKRGRPRKTESQLKKPRRGSEQAKRKMKRGKKRCSFLNAQDLPCMAPVIHTADDGTRFCVTHRKMHRLGYGPQMDAATVNHKIDQIAEQRGVKEKVPPPSHIGAEELPDITKYRPLTPRSLVEEESQKKLGCIRFKKPGEEGYNKSIDNPNFKHGKRDKSGVQLLDYEYYTPDYKNDHIYLLDLSIIRAHATVNMLFSQLQKIEQEEDQLKKIEQYGTMMTEQGPTEFHNITKRHVTPMETKLKLIEALQKAEANYARLLKQKEELLLTALLVLRKIGVKWSREAGMMVVEKIERAEMSPLEEAGLIDVKPQLEQKDTLDAWRTVDVEKVRLEQQQPVMDEVSEPLRNEEDW